MRNLRFHKVQILSKLKHRLRKRSFLEANYTITLEKVPYQSDEILGKNNVFEDYLEYENPEEYQYHDNDFQVDFSNYDYYEEMNFLKPDLNTMKLDLTQVKSEDLKNEAPWIGLINGQCNAVFVNKRFLLSSKRCIETLNLRKLKFERNCKEKTKEKKTAKSLKLHRKVDFFQDFALMKLASKVSILTVIVTYKFTLFEVRKVKFLSKNSILTTPPYFHEFFTPNFF